MSRRNRGKKRGRPVKFNEKLAARIIALASVSSPKPLTEDEISEAVGISRSTLALWKGKYEGFSDAIEGAKSVADEMVEIGLWQRAVGYQHKAIKHFFDSESLQIVTAEYIEQYPPDTSAAKFWLQNRRSRRWRDVQKHEHSGRITLEDLVAGPTNDEDEGSKG